MCVHALAFAVYICSLMFYYVASLYYYKSSQENRLDAFTTMIEAWIVSNLFSFCATTLLLYILWKISSGT